MYTVLANQLLIMRPHPSRFDISGFPTLKFFPKTNKDGESVSLCKSNLNCVREWLCVEWGRGVYWWRCGCRERVCVGGGGGGGVERVCEERE